MAILSQLFRPEIYQQLSPAEQQRMVQWLHAELLDTMPASVQETILHTESLLNGLTRIAGSLLGCEKVEQTTISEDEPIFDLDNIQGNILGGFNKDHQMLLFLQIDDVPVFKSWLTDFIPTVSTSAQVIAFNRLFKAVVRREGEPASRPPILKATWRNIAFSFDALKRVIPDADLFHDTAFREGMVARAGSLGDTDGTGTECDPANWLVGGTNTPPADVVLVVASDDAQDLKREVAHIRENLRGATFIFEQPGNNLPKSLGLSGHEHFGFRDGVSQPGIRGRCSASPNDFLTPRNNPNDPNQGKPGQDLLWPGEFVFGYPGQNSDPTWPIDAMGPIVDAGPAWAKDGSFLVFRRLRQDVFAFHSFLQAMVKKYNITGPTNTSAARLVASRLVGRWPSGAPVLRTPDEENFALALDECANNHFEYQEETEPFPASLSSATCKDVGFPLSKGDVDGSLCPFTGHIRKVYPRDDISNHPHSGAADVFCPDARLRLGEHDTQKHRLLRRGIPYGPASRSTPEQPRNDNVDRGLLFLAYQTSISNQFEFVVRCWANNAEFKEPLGAGGGGHDPLIGQNPGGTRQFDIIWPDPDNPHTIRRIRVSTKANWVITTGGGYFFSPSIRALCYFADPGV